MANAAADLPAAPPVPPPLVPPLRPAPGLLRHHAWKNSFAELWRDTRSPRVVLFWLAKVLRLGLDGSSHDPDVESLAACAVDHAQLPPRLAARLEPEVRKLGPLGFDEGGAVYTAVLDLLGPSLAVAAIVPHRDGRTCSRITCREDGTGLEPKTHLDCELFSEDADGRILLTSGVRARPDAPPGVEVVASPEAPPAQLFRLHQPRLERARRVAALELIEHHHALVRDFHLARGRTRPLTPDEREDLAALEQAWERHLPSGELVAGTAVEMVRLQRKRAGVSESLVLLLLSLAAFVLSWRTGTGRTCAELLTLVPVLFFHELGHWLAMRRFGYGNVRMFFVPFLGAAVSGREQGVSSAKQALVALAGPLPGIVLGVALAFAGAGLQRPALTGPALVLLALNGLNLLPIFPLDGGRVVQLVLFSRSAFLDIGFRAVAALGLLWASLRFDDAVLRGVAIVLLVSLPAAWAVRKTGALLRAQFAPASSDAAQLAPDVAKWLIERLHADRKRVKTKRVLAQLAQQALTQAATLPPRWLPSLGLGALQFVGVVLALAGMAATVHLGRKAYDPFAASAYGGPNAVDVPLRAPEVVRLPASAPAPELDGSLLARFRHPNAAALSAASHPELDALQLGNLAVFARPADAAARAHLVQQLRGAGAEVAERFLPPFLKLRCEVPEPAQLLRELDSYCRLPEQLGLTPPWNREPSPQALRARATLRRLLESHLGGPIFVTSATAAGTVDAVVNDPAVGPEQRTAARSALAERRRQLEAIRADSRTDAAVVEAFLAAFPLDRVVALRPRPQGAVVASDTEDDEEDAVDQDDVDERWAVLGTELSARLDSAGTDTSTVAVGCVAQHRGAQLLVSFYGFDDFTRGPEAVIRWLETRGCDDLHLLTVLPLDAARRKAHDGARTK